jgi:hypothetical protein
MTNDSLLWCNFNFRQSESITETQLIWQSLSDRFRPTKPRQVRGDSFIKTNCKSLLPLFIIYISWYYEESNLLRPRNMQRKATVLYCWRLAIIEGNKIRSRSLPLGSHQFPITTQPRFVRFWIILHLREITLTGSDRRDGNGNVNSASLPVLTRLWEDKQKI